MKCYNLLEMLPSSSSREKKRRSDSSCSDAAAAAAAAGQMDERVVPSIDSRTALYTVGASASARSPPGAAGCSCSSALFTSFTSYHLLSSTTRVFPLIFYSPLLLQCIACQSTTTTTQYNVRVATTMPTGRDWYCFFHPPYSTAAAAAAAVTHF